MRPLSGFFHVRKCRLSTLDDLFQIVLVPQRLLVAPGLLTEIIDNACKRLRAQTGSLILRKWGFSTDFIISALEAEMWHRDKGITPDYCDLVVIAQLHSFVGTSDAFSAPAIHEVPAHSRLALGELTPRLSLRILDEAKEQIAHTVALLNI